MSSSRSPVGSPSLSTARGRAVASNSGRCRVCGIYNSAPSALQNIWLPDINRSRVGTGRQVQAREGFVVLFRLGAAKFDHLCRHKGRKRSRWWPDLRLCGQLGETKLAVKAPSTGRIAPETYFARSLARNSEAFAMSQASPICPVGVCASRLAHIASTSPSE